MALIRSDEYLYVPERPAVNLYATLKSTSYATYVPYFRIQVEEWILTAVSLYFRTNSFAGLNLEEYLRIMETR